MAENEKPTGANGGSNGNLRFTSNGNSQTITENKSDVNIERFFEAPARYRLEEAEDLCWMVRIFRDRLRGDGALLRDMNRIVRACDVVRDKADQKLDFILRRRDS